MSQPKFFIHREGKDVGPFSFDQLIKLLQEKRISDATLIRQTSRQEYIKLGELIKNLKLAQFMNQSDPLHGMRADGSERQPSQTRRRTRNPLGTIIGLLLLGFIGYALIKPQFQTGSTKPVTPNEPSAQKESLPTVTDDTKL